MERTKYLHELGNLTRKFMDMVRAYSAAQRRNLEWHVWKKDYWFATMIDLMTWMDGRKEHEGDDDWDEFGSGI